jgi:hypothetical protein
LRATRFNPCRSAPCQRQCSEIIEYTKVIDEDGFLKNNLIQDAVIRNFEIVGEAAKKLNDDFRAKYSEIDAPKTKPLPAAPTSVFQTGCESIK